MSERPMKKRAEEQLRLSVPLYMNFEELLNLILNLPQFQTTPPIKILSKLNIFLAKSNCYNILSSLSFEEMFLLFYMKQAFGKEWNDSRQEWL